MSQHKFIDRKEELEMLGYDHSRNDSSLFIIYGRRRVGKTELINQFFFAINKFLLRHKYNTLWST